MINLEEYQIYERRRIVSASGHSLNIGTFRGSNCLSSCGRLPRYAFLGLSECRWGTCWSLDPVSREGKSAPGQYEAARSREKRT